MTYMYDQIIKSGKLAGERRYSNLHQTLFDKVINVEIWFNESHIFNRFGNFFSTLTFSSIFSQGKTI